VVAHLASAEFRATGVKDAATPGGRDQKEKETPSACKSNSASRYHLALAHSLRRANVAEHGASSVGRPGTARASTEAFIAEYDNQCRLLLYNPSATRVSHWLRAVAEPPESFDLRFSRPVASLYLPGGAFTLNVCLLGS